MTHVLVGVERNTKTAMGNNLRKYIALICRTFAAVKGKHPL